MRHEVDLSRPFAEREAIAERDTVRPPSMAIVHVPLIPSTPVLVLDPEELCAHSVNDLNAR